MNKSDSIAKIAKALSLAQAEMSGAKKKSSNPFFKSRYSDLSEIIHCIKEPFSNNNLSYMQFPITEDGRAGVETIIMHESGEYISSEFLLKVVKNDPQGMGSAITYARRYGLQSAVGVPSEDDDGNAASKQSRAPKKAEKTEKKKLPPLKERIDKMITAFEQINVSEEQVLRLSEVEDSSKITVVQLSDLGEIFCKIKDGEKEVAEVFGEAE